MVNMFSVTVKGAGSGVLHNVRGEMPRGFGDVTTVCNRAVRIGNVFRDLNDYRQSYNVNGRLCAACAKCT